MSDITIEQTREIINNLLINNDIHVSEIILSYVYEECIKCKSLITDINMLQMFNNKYLCIYCFTKYEFKRCTKCVKLYEIGKNNFCISCAKKCKIFCTNCLPMNFRFEED